MWSAQRHNPLILDGLHLYQQVLAGHWWFLVWATIGKSSCGLIGAEFTVILGKSSLFLVRSGPFIAFNCKVCES